MSGRLRKDLVATLLTPRFIIPAVLILVAVVVIAAFARKR